MTNAAVVTERGRVALGVDQYLARSFRAMAALVAAALLIALATFVVVLGIFQPQLDRLSDGRSADRLTNQGMLDQETGVRGYLLTGDVRFLEPYSAGLRELRDGEAQVDADLGQNSELVPLITPTRVAAHAWMQQWAEPLAAQFATGTSAEVLDAGRRLFDTYRTRNAVLVQGIDAQIGGLRRDRDVTLRISAIVQTAIFVVVIGLTLRQHRRLRNILLPPVNALLAAMRRARDGDLEVRAAVDGPAEVRQIATGFNEMTRALGEERSVRASRETEVMYQAAKLTELLDMARNLAGSLNLRYVLDAASSHALSVSGFQRVCIWLPDEERTQLLLAHCATAQGRVELERDPLALDGGGAVGRAATLGEMTTATGDGDMAEGVASMVAVPMIVGGRVVGVIELSSPRLYVLPEGAVAVVETLASQAGTAVEAARLHQRTEELSQIDALTRLFNRRRLGTDLEAEWKSSRRYLRPLSFCMFDVDHFKQFNDRHGHRSGDAVLEEVARLVAGAIRGSDSAYRYGGEEFALLLRDTPLDAATALCERLRVRVAERYREEADGFVITASFGVAQAHDAMLGPQELVEIADGALYDAKRAGRDRVVAVRREEQLDASS